MNLVFVLLLVAAGVAGLVKHDVKAVAQGAFAGASNAVVIAIGLVGVWSLWLGLLKIAEQAGLVAVLAKLVRPLFRRLFPEVPADHPAISAMLLNVVANMLGLTNAATPFGIKALEELEKLNPTPGTASNAEVLFLVINTGSIQLFPAAVIGYRIASHSANPEEIILPGLITGVCALAVGITSAKLLQRVWK
ncbi:MAG TPA: nucleoside recognition domain-containing protein [Myxococcales bacterium]|jgi:spore maturation protein A|nr:nucleoside recognition domain-containing protein [Myxococcales bacterium]